MLGLLLLYWIGKYYYKLAEENNKHQWGFTILGIVAYYVGTILFSFIFGIVVEIISPGLFETINKLLLSLIVIPFGVLNSYLLYIILEKKWKKNI